ncbi:putative reverse transcriptase domain-containing protein [Tanacetum coccineum]
MVDEHLTTRIGYAVQTAFQSYKVEYEKEAQAEQDRFIKIIDKSVKEMVKNKVKSQLNKTLPKQIADFATPVIQSIVDASIEDAVLAKSSSQTQSTYAAAASLTEFELTKILIDKMEENKSHLGAEYKNTLYDALVHSYNTDKDLYETYGDVVTLKRIRDDDKDEDPSVGSNRGEKRRKTEEPSHGLGEHHDQEFDTRNDVEQPDVQAVSKEDWFKKPEKPNFRFTHTVLSALRRSGVENDGCWINPVDGKDGIGIQYKRYCWKPSQVSTYTLLGIALTWWNSHVKAVGLLVAYDMPWNILSNIMTAKYCPHSDIKKLEHEIWNLKVKGTEHASYTQHFQELELLCGRMFSAESDEEAIELANELMDQKVCTYAEIQVENKRTQDDSSRDYHNQNQQLNKKQNVVRAYTAGSDDKKEYRGSLPKCTKFNYHHQGPCAPRCHNCNKVGHLAHDCRNPACANDANGNNQRNQGTAQRGTTFFECGAQGNFMKDCPKLKDFGNQAT